MQAPPFDLLLITPDREPGELLERTRAALEGVPVASRIAVQLRSKQLTPPRRSELAYAMQALCSARRVPLLINADLELARAVGAAGVQLPESGPGLATARAALGPSALLGASRHDEHGVREAERAGASFVLVSPVFAVPGKNPALGLEGLRRLAEGCSVPLVALGGIDARTAPAVRRHGASAVAVIREVFDAVDPAVAVRALLAPQRTI